MIFDYVLGNPPYKGNGNPLYLKILKDIKKSAINIIWLCPTQWVKSIKPNNFYDEYKGLFKDSLCEFKDLKNPFDDAIVANTIGLFIFKPTKEPYPIEDIKWLKFKNKDFAESIYNKAKAYIKNHKSIDDERQKCIKEFLCVGGRIRGHVDDNANPIWDWTTLFSEKYRNNFKDKSVLKNKRKNLWWSFDTEVECRNFVDYCENDIVMFLLYLYKIKNDNDCGEISLIPYMNDYRNNWDTKMIQDELNLNNDEVEYIKDEMKRFGWKTKN